MDAQDASCRGYTMCQQGAKTRADNLYANGGAWSSDNAVTPALAHRPARMRWRRRYNIPVQDRSDANSLFEPELSNDFAE